MNFKAITLAVLLSCTLSVVSGYSQTRSTGLFNSPKGFGVNYEVSRSGGSFDSFLAYADISGIVFHNESKPGFTLRYSHLYRLTEYNNGKWSSRFHFGPGLTLGYVTDVGASYGLAFAVNCNAGWRFTFPGKPIVMDLDFTANLGLHVRSESGITKLALFKRGLYETIAPQLTISYVF